jgi:hypothetical protein
MTEKGNSLITKNDPNIADQIEKNDPVCYAYNIANGTSNVGTFTPIIENGNYFAISCFHVFGSSTDLVAASKNRKHVLKDKTVKFLVGNQSFDGTIVSYEFGNVQGQGKDFCKCNITKELYDAYMAYIDQVKLHPSSDSQMIMFGAYSKFNVKFKKGMSSASCNIPYGSFTKGLQLFRIIPWNNNVNKGDSGSIVYYKTQANGPVFRVMVVSKNPSYTFVSLIP